MDEIERLRRQLAKSNIIFDGSKYRQAKSIAELQGYLANPELLRKRRNSRNGFS